jgi:hypothetical protein
MLGTVERTAAAVNAIPQLLGAQYTAPNLLFSKNQQAAGLSNLLNISGIGGSTGFGAVTLTPATFAGEIKRREALQKADINNLAASGNYDTSWIRQQLRLGKTPEEIGILLQAGQGQLTTGNKPLTSKQTTTYGKALGSL